MNIELGTLMSLKSRADDIVSELVTLYINTTRELSKSVNNIESSGLKEKNRELLIYISDNYSKTVKNLRHCIKFMDAQIKAYDLTKEEISKSINTLINTIYLSLDSEGNIMRYETKGGFFEDEVLQFIFDENGKFVSLGIANWYVYHFRILYSLYMCVE